MRERVGMYGVPLRTGGRENCGQDIIYERRTNKREKEAEMKQEV